jgi:hypothetical protein
MEGHGRKLHRTSPANGVSVAAGAPHGHGTRARPRGSAWRHARPLLNAGSGRLIRTQAPVTPLLRLPSRWQPGSHAALGVRAATPPRPRRASTHPPGQEISARRRPRSQPPGRCDLPATRGGSPPSVCGIGPCWAARWRGNVPREILSTILLFEIYVYHYHSLNSIVWLVYGADLLWDNIIVNWLVMVDLFWKKYCSLVTDKSNERDESLPI